MNKDVKKLISEAFNELYEELMSEAPQTLRKTKIDDSEVDSIIQNSMRRGTPVPNLFASEDVKSRENFDKIIDALAADYKATKNPKSKEAIQGSFYPAPGSKMQRSVGAKFLGNPELEDAAASAYEQVLIGNFDKILDLYKPGTRGLGAVFTNDMRNKVFNYIVQGYRGGGEGSKFDAVGGEEKAYSLDEPLGDDGDGTFADKLSGLSIGPETAMEKGFAKEKSIENQRNILQNVISWLDNTFEEEDNEMGRRRMTAFKGLVAGDTPEEIAADYPEYFKEPRLVTQEFSRLVNSPEAQEISRIISQIHGINFNLANIDPKKLKQQSSMKPEFGGFSKMVRQATPEMEEAQKELNAALAVVGLKSTDFTGKKKDAIIQQLQSSGKGAELEDILNADDKLTSATEKAKELGKYQKFEPILPSSAEEEEASGERMFETFKGFSIDKLMERVYKRIQKL
jgi:hypothetical protein